MSPFGLNNYIFLLALFLIFVFVSLVLRLEKNRIWT
jgi:hypothetical protein